MDTTVLLPLASTVDRSWVLLEEALNAFEPNVELEREQPDEQVREELRF
ncbi:MAG: hypothetical protein RLY58_309 [Pseudomonadota bacterium]|jgi:hypothetical protein